MGESDRNRAISPESIRLHSKKTTVLTESQRSSKSKMESTIKIGTGVEARIGQRAEETRSSHPGTRRRGKEKYAQKTWARKESHRREVSTERDGHRLAGTRKKHSLSGGKSSGRLNQLNSRSNYRQRAREVLGPRLRQKDTEGKKKKHVLTKLRAESLIKNRKRTS